MSDPLDSVFLEGMPDSRVVARDMSPDGRLAIAAVSVSGGPGDVAVVHFRRSGGRWDLDGRGSTRGWTLTSNPEAFEPTLGVLFEARRRRGDGAWELECRWDVPPPGADYENMIEFDQALYAGITGAEVATGEASPDSDFLVVVVVGDDGRARLISGYHGNGGYIRHTCSTDMVPTQIDVAAFDQGGPTLGVLVTPRLEDGEWKLDCVWDPPPTGDEPVWEPPPKFDTADDALRVYLPEGYDLGETRRSPRGDHAAALAVRPDKPTLVVIASWMGDGWLPHGPSKPGGSIGLMTLTTDPELHDRPSPTIRSRRRGGRWVLDCDWGA